MKNMKRAQRKNTKPSAEPKLDAMHQAIDAAQKAGDPVYRVIKAFKYDGAWMEAGKPWIPMGFPNDDKIISSGRYVMLIDSRLPAFSRPRTAHMRVTGA
jgi:hypothetical protein